MSEETIKPPSTKDNSFHPEIIYKYGQARGKGNQICLRQDSKFIYFSQTRYMVKRFKNRFHNR